MRYLNRYRPLNISPNTQKLLNRLQPVVLFIFLFLLCWWVVTRPYEVAEDEPSQSMSARRILLEPMELICRRESDLLIFVHSRTEAIDRRNEWRKNYGKLDAKYKYALIFSLGFSSDPIVNYDIENESKLNGDILQGDFLDSYRNITHKHLMGLRYAATKPCSQIPVIFKVDDDLAMNVKKLAKITENIKKDDKINQKTEKEPRIWCKLTPNVTIQRMSNEKWAIPRSRLPETKYPDYCSGMGIFYPRSAIPKLLKAAEQEKWFWLDDVLLTGYLRLRANISIMDISNEYETDYEKSDLTLFTSGKAAFRYVERDETNRLFHLVNDLA